MMITIETEKNTGKTSKKKKKMLPFLNKYSVGYGRYIKLVISS